jgi:hypothetical protein
MVMAMVMIGREWYRFFFSFRNLRLVWLVFQKVDWGICLQDKDRETWGCYDLADAEFFHDTFLAGCVDGATHVDCKIEYAYLSGDQQLPS